MNKMKKIGIEALRVIAMCMVVFLHVLGEGIQYTELQPFTLHWFAGWFLEGVCYCAVNVYAMISGYVMVNSNCKISRLIGLWLEVTFYTVTSTFLLYIIEPNVVGIQGIIKAFFPVCSQKFWYFTAYFGMFWFIPILNWLVHKLDFVRFRNFVLGLVVVFSLLPWASKVLGGAPSFGIQDGYTTLWLSVLYLIGAGIRVYGVNFVCISKKEHSNIWFLNMALLSGGLVFLSKVLLTYFTKVIFGREILTAYFYNYLSPLVIMEAIFLLYFFSKVQMHKNENFWITVGKATFGIYLIHQTQAFKYFIWPLFEKCTDKSFFIFISTVVGGAIIIFAGCYFIECVRMKIFAMCKIDEICDKFIRKYQIRK